MAHVHLDSVFLGQTGPGLAAVWHNRQATHARPPPRFKGVSDHSALQLVTLGRIHLKADLNDKWLKGRKRNLDKEEKDGERNMGKQYTVLS